MAKWQTTRGDEWWYDGGGLQARADWTLATDPPTFVVSLVGGNLTVATLLAALHAARRDVPDGDLHCSLDCGARPLLESLRRSGLVRWDLVSHPHSQEARIIEMRRAWP